MGNTSLENRKKRYEEKQRESYIEKNGGNASFNKALEERINRYNSKTKWENQIDTNVWMAGNPLEEFARDYAVRKANEAARQERKERIAQKNAVRSEMTDYRRLGEIQLKAQKRPFVQSVAGTAGNIKAAGMWRPESRKPSAYQDLQKEGTWQQENRRLAEAKQKAWNEKRKAEQQVKIEQNRKNMTGIIEKGPFKEGLERVVPYDELKNRSDFWEQVERGKGMWGNPVTAIDEGNRLIEIGKDVAATTVFPVWGAYSVSEKKNRNLEQMSREEKNVYDYLYSRYGADQADTYMSSLASSLNQRAGQKMYEKAAEFRENHTVLGTAANIGQAAGAGVLSLAEGISRIPSMIAGDPIAEVPLATDYYMGMLQENTESFPERSAYEAANSIGFMLPGALLGGALGSAAAGSSLFAAGVTGNAYNEAVMEGKDIDRARAYALASGASEEATQLLLGGVAGLSSGIGKKLFANSRIAAAAAKGLDGLIKNDKARKVVMGAGNLGADMVSEGTQEYTQELLDKAMRNMLFDEKNQIRLDDPDAWHAAFLGAVTAGAMNTPGMVTNAVSEMRGKPAVLPEMNEETIHPDDMQEETKTPHIADFDMQAEDSRVEPENTEYEPETELKTEVMQQEVNESEAERIDQEETDILEETKVQFGPNGKTAYVDQYDKETWMPAYTRAFQRAYSAGRYKVDMDVAQRSAVLAQISNEQFMAAWKAGVQDRELALESQKPLVQGQERTGSMTDLSSESSSAQRAVAEHVGKLTGLKIELVDEMPNKVEATYSKGKIKIAVNSDDFLGSTSHELTHFIKDYAPEQYRDYEDVAVKALMKAEQVNFESLYERYMDQYADAGQTMTHDEIVEEMVADATQKFFNDEDFIQEVAAKNETIGQKILNFINDVIDAIQELIHKGTSRKAAAGLEENLVMYKRARRSWMQALEEAGTVYQSGGINAGSAERQYQLNQFGLEEYTELEKENWEKSSIMICNSRKDIIDFCENNLHRTPYKKLYIGKIGNDLADRLYKDTGMRLDNYNIVLTSWFENSHADAEKEAKRGQIAVTPEMIADLPEIISSYDRVLDAGKTQQGKPVLQFEKEINGKRVAIEYVSDKKKSLTVQTMYAWSNKNRNLPTAPDALASAQTPETLSGTVPTDFSIKDKKQGVNGDNKRFQLEDVEDYINERDVNSLLKENEELREANELLKKQFELTSKEEIRQSDIHKVSVNILKKYESGMKADKLDRNITRLYEYIRSGDRVAWNEVAAVAADIGREILKQSTQVDTTMSEQYAGLRKKIKNTKITLSDQDKQDLAAAGGYNSFRKKYFGTLKLGKDGISVDSLYQELSDQHPELFDIKITHPEDQLIQIGMIMDITKPQIKNPYHANMDEMAYLVGQELLQEYYNVRQPAPTFADRKEAELEKAKRDYQKKLEKYKEKMKTQYGTLTQLKAQKEKYEWQLKTRSDRLKKAEAKNRIIKEHQKLSRWMIQPTDKQHVPKVLQNIVGNALLHIDYSSDKTYTNEALGIYNAPLKRTTAFLQMSRTIQGIIDNGGITEDKDYVDFDPDIAEKMAEISGKLDNIKKLDDLNLGEMITLRDVICSLRTTVTQANKIHSNARWSTVEELAGGIMDDAESRAQKVEYEALKGGDKLLNFDMMQPLTFFKKLGKHAESIQQSLRAGQDKRIQHLQECEDFKEKTFKELGISNKDVASWSGPYAKRQKIKLSNGTIEMTVAEMMDFYLTEQQKQGKGHIYSEEKGQGIKRAPKVKQGGVKTLEKDGKKIKEYAPSVIETDYFPIRLTKADGQKIIEMLTPEQKKLANRFQVFVERECGSWGNEVSMAQYGYEKFGAKGYWPISTDQNYIAQKEGDFSKGGSIKNLGFTKSRVNKANAPVIVEDVFEKFSRHVHQMAIYNSLVLPLSDMHKVINYKRFDGSTVTVMKDLIQAKYGKEAVEYWQKYVEDINGQTRESEMGLQDKWISNMKAASVSGNLRVAIQQPTAIMRAANEIDPKYLLHGAVTPVEVSEKELWEKMCTYCPIVQWKDWGFSKMGHSQSFNQMLFGTAKKVDKVRDKAGILAEIGDKVAWKRIWKAVEYETREEHKELEVGSEAYYQHVGKRTGEIIDKTQVVDTVMHRAQIMRSNNRLTQMATAFMSEPVESYNMMYRAGMDVKAMKPDKLHGKMAKVAGRAAATYVVTAAMTAAAASVMDAYRDDDRDKEWGAKWLESFKANFIDSLLFINNIPYLKDAYSMLQGYEPRRTDMQWMQDILYAFNRIAQKRNGNSPYTWKHIALYTLQQSSAYLGIPIKSITRDIIALVDTGMNVLGGGLDYKWLKLKYDVNEKTNLTFYTKLMLQAHREGNAKLQEQIRNDMLKAGNSNDDIQKKMKSIVKSELISNDATDPRIEAAVQARLEMNEVTYETSIAELLAEGYNMELISSAVDTAMGKLSGDEEIDVDAEVDVAVESLYEGILAGKTADKEATYSMYDTSDVLRQVEQIDGTKESLDNFDRTAAKIVEEKKKEGKTESQARGSIKSAITRKYKEKWVDAYQRGDKKKCSEIQDRLKYLRVNGKALYSRDDWSDWLDAAKK